MAARLRAMSGSKKTGTESKVAIISYDYDKAPPVFYATGARIMVLGPYHVKLNFFVDEIEDDVVEETVYEKDGSQNTVPTKKRYEGPRHVHREFKATVFVPLATAEGLKQALDTVLKGPPK